MSYHAVHLAACAGCPCEIVLNEAVGFWLHTTDHGSSRDADHDARPLRDTTGRTIGHATGQRDDRFDAEGFRIGRFDADGNTIDYDDEFSRYE